MNFGRFSDIVFICGRSQLGSSSLMLKLPPPPPPPPPPRPYIYTLRNEGYLAALKEPLWFFCETRGSFDDVGQ